MVKKKTTASALKSSITEAASQKAKIGNNVRKLRQERKWTQWQLAQISRLSQRSIQRIERGARMGITAELALAGAFELEISELYASAQSGNGGETNPEMPKTSRILKRLVSGAALLDVIEAGQLAFDASFEHEPRQRQAIEDLLQHISVWHVAGREVESGDREKACHVFQSLLDELDACDVYVFGARSSKSQLDDTRRESALIFKRADDPQIIQPRLLSQFGKSMCIITLPVNRESTQP